MLTNIGTQSIETKRLILRRFEFSDTEAVYINWAGDEKVQNAYGEPVYSTEEAVRELLESEYERLGE